MDALVSNSAGQQQQQQQQQQQFQHLQSNSSNRVLSDARPPPAVLGRSIDSTVAAPRTFSPQHTEELINRSRELIDLRGALARLEGDLQAEVTAHDKTRELILRKQEEPKLELNKIAEKIRSLQIEFRDKSEETVRAQQQLAGAERRLQQAALAEETSSNQCRRVSEELDAAKQLFNERERRNDRSEEELRRAQQAEAELQRRVRVAQQKLEQLREMRPNLRNNTLGDYERGGYPEDPRYSAPNTAPNTGHNNTPQLFYHPEENGLVQSARGPPFAQQQYQQPQQQQQQQAPSASIFGSQRPAVDYSELMSNQSQRSPAPFHDGPRFPVTMTN